MVVRIVRIGIQLPEAYEKKARRIAKFKGVPRASWIANLVQSRIEEIYSKYEGYFENEAKDLGISLEDYLAQLDNGGEDND